MALVADGDKWRELIAGGLFSLTDVRAHLASERARWDLPDQWAVEELQLAPDGTLPNDIKVYAFRGRVGCVLVRSSGLPHRYRWFTPDLEPTRVGKSWYTIDDSLALPDPGTVADAARVSSQLPVPFMRVDVYETAGGTVFGELTPYPASYEWFTDTWDHRLGTLYEEAETELIASRTDPSAVAGSVLG
ncbi:MAG: ATP-grasp fold amidoligase family protein [Natronosporangium sp.]